MVAADFPHLKQDAKAFGLVLNHRKCVIGPTPEIGTTWDSIGFTFQKSCKSDASLLGLKI